MHVLVGVNLLSGQESGEVSSGFHGETDPVKDGNPWVIRAPESVWK